MAKREEIAEEYRKHLDGRLDRLRKIVKDIEKSVMTCEGADVVYNWGKFIDSSGSFRQAGYFMRSMEDITEEEWDGYKEKLDEIEIEAGRIVGTFTIHCICIE